MVPGQEVPSVVPAALEEVQELVEALVLVEVEVLEA